jgi:hypothetical protein
MAELNGVGRAKRGESWDHERRASTNNHERRAIRLCLLSGTSLSLVHLDYRWWQCRRCGWDPDDAVVWAWWSKLHHKNREELVRLSRRVA